MTAQNESLQTLLENRKSGEFQCRWMRSTEADHIKYCIRSILLTRKGERIFYPNTGGNLMAFLFQQYQSRTVAAIQLEIQNTIEASEKRVNVHSVVVDRDELDPQRISVAIQYEVRRTGQLDSLSFQIKP